MGYYLISKIESQASGIGNNGACNPISKVFSLLFTPNIRVHNYFIENEQRLLENPTPSLNISQLKRGKTTFSFNGDYLLILLFV